MRAASEEKNSNQAKCEPVWDATPSVLWVA